MTNSRASLFCRRIFTLIVLVSIVQGCTAVTLSDVRISTVPGQKVPLKVALVLDKALCGRVEVCANPVQLGEALCRGARDAFGLMFEEVVVMDDNTPIPESGIAAVIRPELISFDHLSIGCSDCRLTCKWTVTGKGDRVLYMNTVTSHGKGDAVIANTRIRQTLGSALEQQYSDVMSSMISSHWWERAK